MDWIVVAMDKEAEKIDNKNIIVTGIGVENVIKKMSDEISSGRLKKNDRIINVGYCGAKGFNVGDVISITKSRRHKQPKAIKESSFELKPLTEKTATCYTFDDFEENADCDGVMDMELFYLASFFPNIQSIKVVSDNGDYEEYERNLKKINSWSVVNSILKKKVI